MLMTVPSHAREKELNRIEIALPLAMPWSDDARLENLVFGGKDIHMIQS